LPSDKSRARLDRSISCAQEFIAEQKKIVMLRNQFLEKTEMVGGKRKNDAGRLKDNPRRLGKGRARLVGTAPPRPGREARKPEAGFTSPSGGVRAPSATRNRGLAARSDERNHSELSQVTQESFDPE